MADKEVKVEQEEKKKVKSNKPSFWQRIKNFFKGLKSECKKVVWYGKKATLKSSALVIVSLVVVAAIVAVIDIGLVALVSWLAELI